jgi:iron complex transport system substrate-binding protein
MRLLIAIALLVLCGCRTHRFEDGTGKSISKREPFRGVPSTNLTDGCVEDYRPDVDYFPDKTALRYARIFTVSYHGNYKVVKLAADPGVTSNEKVTDTMVLLQCGTPAPVLTGKLAGATLITIPLMTIAANDNCDIAAISELGFDDRMTAVGGGEIYNEKVRERWRRKELASIGYAWHTLPNVEVLLAQPPDAVFIRRSTLEHGEAVTRARSLGIRAVPSLSRREGHYLGFAEWVKYFALFLNAERTADNLFTQVSEKSERLTRQAQQARVKPTVFWGDHTAGGTWSVARSPHDLLTSYLTDAGAINPFFDGKALPGGEVPNEKLLGIAAEADFWLTSSRTMKGWPDESFLSHFKAYRSHRVYSHHKRSDGKLNIWDWYETGALRPDLVLEDLVSLFHPEIVSNHELMFFERSEREVSH